CEHRACHFPYTTLFRSEGREGIGHERNRLWVGPSVGEGKGGGCDASLSLAIGCSQLEPDILAYPLHELFVLSFFAQAGVQAEARSEEHTSELQSRSDLV